MALGHTFVVGARLVGLPLSGSVETTRRRSQRESSAPISVAYKKARGTPEIAPFARPRCRRRWPIRATRGRQFSVRLWAVAVRYQVARGGGKVCGQPFE